MNIELFALVAVSFSATLEYQQDSALRALGKLQITCILTTHIKMILFYFID